MTWSDKITLDEEILFRAVGSEGVVVDQRKAEVIVVNALGLKVLELLRREEPRHAIIDTIAAQYDSTESQVTADVDAFLEDLSDRGWIR